MTGMGILLIILSKEYFVCVSIQGLFNILLSYYSSYLTLKIILVRFYVYC